MFRTIKSRKIKVESLEAEAMTITAEINMYKQIERIALNNHESVTDFDIMIEKKRNQLQLVNQNIYIYNH